MNSASVLLLASLTAAAAELPIREIVLYKNGVGYFVRSGDLQPGESARFDFKPSDMNDVLKSLTVVSAGGKVAGVRYDSSEPTERKLAEYPFQAAAQQSLAAFFDHMKGAALELKYGSDTVSGVIFSARTIPADKDHPERDQVVLLLDSGEMRALDLSGATAMRFPDPSLQKQLRAYLSVLNEARSTERRTVFIDGSDEKIRQIRATYMMPTPVWKSSYRLIFNDHTDPTLEGWAIIDNTSGDDWTNVRIALVSGRPISFISQLYEPKYVQRQTAELAENEPLKPVVYEGAMTPMAAPVPAPPNPLFRAAKTRSNFAADQVQAAGTTGAIAGMLSSVQATAQGADLGDLFEYRFGQTLTVKRGQSAMLPFVQEAVKARKLLIYSDSDMRNPMNAAEITNSTSKTLDGGPITVYDGDAYAGEALIETLKAGDKRLISYAVDLGTRITTALDPVRSVIREIHFNRGVLITKSAIEETRNYTIRNVDAKPKTLVIEHPIRPDFKLLNQKPVEKTALAYRFEVKLTPDSSETFPVSEERVLEQSTSVSSMSPELILSYVQNKALSDAGRAALQQILAQKRQINDADATVRHAEADIESMTRDQDRLRQNINSLNRVSGQEQQVQKYARQLADSESKLASLRDQASEGRRKKAALESALNSMIEKLEF